VSGYTIQNLRELEDQAKAFGFAPALEARFAREPLGAERVGLSLQRLAPSERAPFAHNHGQDEEIYVVLSGSGQLRVDDETAEVGTMDAIRVAPGAVRAFAAGPDGLEFLAFGQHTPDDAQMQPTQWPE
jgi:uncharacterized cupin superfamily protein